MLTIEIYGMREFCEEENVKRKDLEPLIKNADTHVQSLVELTRQFIREFLAKIDKIFIDSEV